MTATSNTPIDPQFADWFGELITEFFGRLIEADQKEHPTTAGLLKDEGSAINELGKAVNHALMEARYMGAVDFANWIMTHDESNFRQERAWYKVKPKLLLGYQTELMKNLRGIRINSGLDPDATVYQVAHKPPKE